MLASELADTDRDDGEGELPSKAKDMLTKRVADIVCLPSSEITPQERHMAGDVLYEMLREAEPRQRLRCAKRMAILNDPPPRLLRLLAKDNFEIARPILEESTALNDSDLIEIARVTTPQHRKLIAEREEVSELVSEVLTEHDEPDVVRAMLMNDGVRLSSRAVDAIVAASRHNDKYCTLLMRRLELRPAQALTLFWWCGPETRTRIFERFAVARTLLQEAAADVFAEAAAENWSDAASRKALQFIERRQRNRGAIEKSPYDSLEHAIESAARDGMTRETAEEISYLAGIKPTTGAQIMTDMGGEGLAVLCKATGLKRDYLVQLWRALGRTIKDGDAIDPVFGRVLAAYDSLSNDKAQTVLRYWNWSLTTAMSENLMQAIQDDPMAEDEAQSEAARNAALVFSNG